MQYGNYALALNREDGKFIDFTVNKKQSLALPVLWFIKQSVKKGIVVYRIIFKHTRIQLNLASINSSVQRLSH
jgi:hypothetical protein